MQAAFTHIHTLQEKRRNGQLKQRHLKRKTTFFLKNNYPIEETSFCAIKYHIVQGGME